MLVLGFRYEIAPSSLAIRVHFSHSRLLALEALKGSVMTKAQDKREHERRSHPFITNRTTYASDVEEILNRACLGDANGLHAMAVVDWSGLVVYEDRTDLWAVSNRRDAYDILFRSLKGGLKEYHLNNRASSPGKLNDDLKSLFNPEGFRWSVGGHHVAVVHLDPECHLFLMAISWNRQGFNFATFTGAVDSMRSCLEELHDYLANEHDDWFKGN